MSLLSKATPTFLILILAVAAIFALTTGTGTAAIPAGQGPLPTADPCASPTLRPTLNLINVRSGPGTAYDVIGRLTAGDVRPIVGRGAFEPFWQIELEEGGRGWVADSVVQVDGHTGRVPVVEAPAVQGQTATPGATEWNPTPTPACTATYTPTPEPIAVVSTPTPRPNSIQDATGGSEDDGWQLPANLSRSGLGTYPDLVVDEDGVVHLLWQEEGREGFVYARGDDNSWSAPTVVELPFGARAYYPDLDEDSAAPLFQPTLLADGDGLIHAYWIDEEETLWHSRVPSAAFDIFNAWTPRQLVDEGVIRVTASVEGAELHVAYIRGKETDARPAGVYYRRSEDSGGSWSTSTLLYQSRYFGSPVGREAQLHVATEPNGAASSVYVAWADPALEKMFVIRSVDGGDSWEPPSLVDRRGEGDAADAVRPSSPVLAAVGDSALLMWQAGHENAGCSQYFQLSNDGGATWTAARPMLEELGQCPTHNQVLQGRAGMTLLFTVTGGQPYLVAWDGQRWSKPQTQEMLASFENPETYRYVTLGCYDAVLSGDHLLVAACQAGEVQDVWVTSRPLEAIEPWFATQVWSESALVASGHTPADFLQIYAGDGGEMHAFWTRADEPTLYYALYDESGWSGAVPVMNLTGIVGHPAIATDAGNDVVMVAWATESAEIWLRRAGLGQGFFSADWSEPLPVATAPTALSGLDIELQGNSVYVAYAVPLNEQRGIYLAHSKNQGSVWTGAAQIVDGAALAWPVVGAPQMVVTDSDVLHMLLTKEEWHPASANTVKRPYYARLQLDDVGPVMPEPVTDEPVRWMQLLVTDSDVLHRFWQEDVETGLGPSHQYTIDGGRDWSEPLLTSNWVGPSAIAADAAGQVHLLQINDAGVLEHRLWAGTRWSLHDGSLEAARWTQAERLAALTTPRETLAVLWSGQMATGSTSDEPSFELLAAQRTISVPDEAISVSVTGRSSLTPAAVATSTLAPTPTPTEAVPALAGSGSPPQGAASQTSQLILGFLPAGLFLMVAMVLFLGIRSLLPRLRQ